MTKLTENQLAAGAEAYRSADPADSVEDRVEAIVAAATGAKAKGSHEDRVADLDADIAAENKKAAKAKAALEAKQAQRDAEAEFAEEAKAKEAAAAEAKG